MEAATCEKCNKPFPLGGACRRAEYLPTINQLSTKLQDSILEQIVRELPQYCSSVDWLFPYLDNPDLEVSGLVAWIIAQLEGPSPRILTHPKDSLREAGLWQIANRGKPGKLENVLPLLEDAAACVRAKAVAALKHVNGRLEHVLPRLQDVEQVQIAAIQVLPFVGGTLEHVLPFLEDENWNIRHTAVTTLPLLQGRLEHVLPRLTDTNESVRYIAVEVLAKLGGRLEHLLPALKDINNEVCAAAVQNLPRLGGQLEHLLPCLQDEEYLVSIAAIQVLPELGGNIEHLRPKLQHPFPDVRKLAIANLFKLGGTLGDLVTFLSDEDSNVRYIAFGELETFVASCEDKTTLGEIVGLCEHLIKEKNLADIKIASRGILELIARRSIGAAMALFNSDDPEMSAEGEVRLKELDPNAIFIEEKNPRQPSPQDVELDD